jgi:hypothetical protein
MVGMVIAAVRIERDHDLRFHVGDDAADIERARLRLAEALLSVADEESRDVAVLKRAALHRLALYYRSLGGGTDL